MRAGKFSQKRGVSRAVSAECVIETAHKSADIEFFRQKGEKFPFVEGKELVAARRGVNEVRPRFVQEFFPLGKGEHHAARLMKARGEISPERKHARFYAERFRELFRRRDHFFMSFMHAVEISQRHNASRFFHIRTARRLSF